METRRYNRPMTDAAINELLGGLSAAAFLRKYWQKTPLLVRQAVGGFRGFLGRSELFALAGRADVVSRHGFEESAGARLDAAGSGRQPPRRCGRRLAATICVHPVRTPRRRHG